MEDAAAKVVTTDAWEAWPELPLPDESVYHLLHRSSQIIGKIRLALAPALNHWWQTALYVTPRGLTTSLIPYGTRAFELELDLLNGHVSVSTSDGERRAISLSRNGVADFYARLLSTLNALGINIQIWTKPVEVEDRADFDVDRRGTFDPSYAEKLHRALIQIDRVMKIFRSRFTGKASPVHFFWGSFDMAATRFSGAPAPSHPGAPNVARRIMVEAYSRELSSCGFWPGAGLGAAAFYSYAYPEPDGYRDYKVSPSETYYHPELREFILPYEVVRRSKSPDTTLLDFFQSTYEAAAELGGWERASLELKAPEARTGPSRATPSIGGPPRPN